MSRILALIILVVSQAASASVSAAGISLEIDVAREVVEVDSDGLEVTRLVPIDSAMPGEVVVYTITYTNAGSDAAENVVITDPLPTEVQYVPGSESGAAGAEFAVSVDGGESFSAPSEALVVRQDGQPRPAEPGDYTHLRWVLADPVLPGASGFLRFRTRIE